MKKNGKKYRKLQKEREKKEIIEVPIIEQEVDDIKTSYLAMAHILTINPIIYECAETKSIYLKYLTKYLKIGKWKNKKYESSMLKAYRKIINQSQEVKTTNGIDYYKHFIVFDLAHFFGYEISKKNREKLKRVQEQYTRDFGAYITEDNLFFKILNASKSVSGINRLQKCLSAGYEIEYAERIKKNLLFRDKKPFEIMITATMSAGKSTFINSLTGKYICLSQNMACTSKIHSIINKPFNDGFSYEYDHDLVLTAGKEELLNDNELNSSDRIYVSTHFDGSLATERVIINDSPGVNFSGDKEHKLIAEKLIKDRTYNLLIYVMNSTQLATNDEDEHLEYIKRIIGQTPILFVMNKTDLYNVEDEDVLAIIKRQTEYLKNKGFKNPVICPVSARAGYLVKQFSTVGLSRSEERELYNYIDKFEQMPLVDYYGQHFPKIVVEDKEQEEEQLLKTCGLAYVEQIIKQYIKGEK